MPTIGIGRVDEVTVEPESSIILDSCQSSSDRLGAESVTVKAVLVVPSRVLFS